MKPIFEKERLFLKEKGVNIPENCWRNGSKIYLNHDDIFPIITFKVVELTDEIIIKKNCIKKIDGSKIYIKNKYKGKSYDEIWINKTLEQEVKENTKRLNKLIGKQVGMTISYLNRHLDYEKRVSISGGKDSSVMNYIFLKWVLPKLKNKQFKYDAFNTTNDTADTYKQMYKEGLKKSDINTPLLSIRENSKIVKRHMGWYQWIENIKEYWIPNALKRSCCSTFKEGQAKLILNKNKKYVTLLGVRKYESPKRSFYEFNIQEAYNKHENKKNNMPDNFKRIAPICYMTNADIWLYILKERIEVNPMYYKGFNRCGCLICPFNSPYTNLLIKKYYPMQWKRWMNIVSKHYDIKNVKNRLKWTRKEYLSGKWRVGLSKEQELIQLKPTPERIKQLAIVKGVSEDIAIKYFNKKCECGKKLNPDEIAMFLKINGRFENIEDNRQYLCKKCLCEKEGWIGKEYSQLVRRFREQDCSLF
ncbi:TPA: phosphoadenosine phosphosulfate reductase family protein [Clostridium botulinum]|nr:phosphoadenosine phosphosulfate reductase family protein [Clostridium botulinum]HCL4455221.1 phosphoadenosine phosphosulfate reductase family protein [Clostridium botulinum]